MPLLGESTNKFKKLFNRNLTRSKYNKMRNWFKGTRKGTAKVAPLQYNLGEVYETNLGNHGIPGNRGNINNFYKNLNRHSELLEKELKNVKNHINAAKGRKEGAQARENYYKNYLERASSNYKRTFKNGIIKKIRSIKSNQKTAENNIKKFEKLKRDDMGILNKYKTLKNRRENAEGNANIMSRMVPGTAANLEEELQNANKESKRTAANVERLQKMIMRHNI